MVTPSVVESVGQEVLQRARRDGIQFGLALTWFVVERLAQRLEQSEHREEVLLYGDLLIHALAPANIPRVWRPEFLWRGAPDPLALESALKAAGRVELDDDLVFDAPFRAVGARPLGPKQRVFEIASTVGFGGARCPLKIQLIEDDQRQFGQVDVRLPSTVRGMNGSRPNACRPEVLLAHLVFALSESGLARPNPKAYADLHRLFSVGEPDIELAAAALAATFESASVQVPVALPLAFSPLAACDRTLNQMWTAFVARARGPDIDLRDLLSQLRVKVLPLFAGERQGTRASQVNRATQGSTGA